MFVDFVKNIKINDGFWSQKLDHVIDNTLPYQWKAINDQVEGVSKSGAVENFKIIAEKFAETEANGGKKGVIEYEDSPFSGFVFQDSDLYKWLEAVSYSLMVRPNPELEKTADEMIDLIGKTQWDDGYINSAYTLNNRKGRFTNIQQDHEMYCAGHMFEAAVAYYVATGKTKFLDISKKFADLFDEITGPQEGKLKAYPGHQEIELALVKLYRVTKDEKYLNLAKFYIDERGKEPNYFTEESKNRPTPEYMRNRKDGPNKYNQSHLPVREQKEAVGHAVRAMYLYSAMTDVAAMTGDETLKDACRTLWENVTKKQMYITGGVGSQTHGEAFSFDYDLPNDEVYAETCAQIGFFLWAHRMFEMDKKSEYADIMERTLYNGIICGVSLDGKKYFYLNPLEIIPEVAEKRPDKRRAAERQGWFSCACCPPNLARVLLSLGSFIYSVDGDEVYANLYIGSEAKINVNGVNVNITQKSSYENDGKVTFVVKPEKPVSFKLKLRIPYWADKTPKISVCGEIKKLSSSVRDGYWVISGDFENEFEVKTETEVNVKIMASNPLVPENAGKIAVTRGPLVYCFEEADNGKKLSALSVYTDREFKCVNEPELLGGVTSITLKGKKDADFKDGELYKEYSENGSDVELKAVPYYAWNNRGVGEMRVWMRKA